MAVIMEEHSDVTPQCRSKHTVSGHKIRRGADIPHCRGSGCGCGGDGESGHSYSSAVGGWFIAAAGGISAQAAAGAGTRVLDTAESLRLGSTAAAATAGRASPHRRRGRRSRW